MSATHTVPLKIYFAIFIALCVLTGLTVWTAKHDYGVWNTPVALAIAGFKASLVILFFMHVKYSSKLTQLFAFAGFFWLVLLLTFTLQDFVTRGMLPTYTFER